MSKLILTTWTQAIEDKLTALGANEQYKSSTKVKVNEKVFVFRPKKKADGTLFENDLFKTNNEANINIVKKSMGLSEPEKRLKMSANYIENINNGGSAKNNILTERIKAIEELNNKIAIFFLENLQDLSWDDIEKGIASTIPVDEAFDLIKPAFMQLREILMAGVEDKYSSDLSLAEMKNIKQAHDLNVEQSLGSNLKTNKKSKKK